MKKVLTYMIIFIVMITIFVGILFFSSTFSSYNIKSNVKKSSEMLENEGNKKSTYIFLKSMNIEFDNYSDALMINTAYSIDNTTPLYSSFIARKNYIPLTTSRIYADSVGELRSASKFNGHDEVGELSDTVDGKITESFEYARYWHGYLVFLRPLLLVFDLLQIRVLLTIVLILIAINVFFNIYKKLDIIYMIIFLLGFASVEYFYMGISIQGCSIFIITMIFIKIILSRFDKIKNIGYYFFTIGMITNFFDLLTNPLITLFVPLIIYFVLIQKKEDIYIKKSILIFLKTVIPWLLGYTLAWLTKWILVDIIYGTNVLETAIGQTLYRMNNDLNVSAFFVIKQNIKYIFVPIIVDIFLIVFISLIKLVGNNKKVKFKNIMKTIFPYLIILVVPYLWYIVVKNHSYIHAFFTYREQVITLIAIPIIWKKYIELKEEKQVSLGNI